MAKVLMDAGRSWIRRIPGGPKAILDLGARDCVESIEFAREYPAAQVYAFECNRATIEDCRANQAAAALPNLQLYFVAVAAHTGNTVFHGVDKQPRPGFSANPGASSLYPASGHMVTEPIKQVPVTVPCTRLDDWAELCDIPSFDVVWMDLQGAERLAIEGMGARAKTIQVLHTEVTYKELYAGQPLYPEWQALMRELGMVEVYHEKAVTVPEWFGEAVYVTKALFESTT